jgi:hypothetical protein
MYKYQIKLWLVESESSEYYDEDEFLDEDLFEDADGISYFYDEEDDEF